jgi:cytochrome c
LKISKLHALLPEKMMKRLIYVLLSVCVSTTAMADSVADAKLAKEKNCMACHSMDIKLVGPAYKEVAKKYAGQKDAEEKLVGKVMKGGSGVWGAVPMPANPQLSQAEATTLVKWILSMK